MGLFNGWLSVTVRQTSKKDAVFMGDRCSRLQAHGSIATRNGVLGLLSRFNGVQGPDIRAA